MSVKLECLGLPCPQPVVMCKNIIESQNPETIIATVDNEAAMENISRFLTTSGYKTATEKKDSIFTITAEKENSLAAPAGDDKNPAVNDEKTLKAKNKTLLFLNNEVMGSGDDNLGAKLMFNFISTLPELGESLWRIIMVNSAVKLATGNHLCSAKLKELESAGISILVCGTCLEHFGLIDKKIVGETTNMLDVVTSFQLADKIIKA